MADNAHKRCVIIKDNAHIMCVLSATYDTFRLSLWLSNSAHNQNKINFLATLIAFLKKLANYSKKLPMVATFYKRWPK